MPSQQDWVRIPIFASYCLKREGGKWFHIAFYQVPTSFHLIQRHLARSKPYSFYVRQTFWLKTCLSTENRASNLCRGEEEVLASWSVWFLISITPTEWMTARMLGGCEHHFTDSSKCEFWFFRLVHQCTNVRGLSLALWSPMNTRQGHSTALPVILMNGPGLSEMTPGLRKTYESKLLSILSGTALIGNC